MGVDPKTTYVHALAAVTAIVGYIIAYVPSWAPYKREMIIAGAVVVAATMLIAHAIRYGKGTPVQDLSGLADRLLGESDVQDIVHKELLTLAGQAATQQAGVGGLPVPSPGSVAQG